MTEKPGAPAPPRGRRFPANRPILIVGILALAAVAITLAHVQGLQTQLVRTQAVQHAELFTSALTEFRTLYTSEVVERIRPHGIEITRDYESREGAVPLPATLSMRLGSQIAALEEGGGARLYSPYPFPPLEEGRGLTDAFAQEAWEALNVNPEEPVVSFETLEGREVLRYATADIMRAECVDCHNTHPDSPKTDWQEGDVRGVLEVITPLDVAFAEIRSGLIDSGTLMLFMAAIGLLFLGFLMSRPEEATKEAAALWEERARAQEQRRASSKIKE